MSIDANPNFKIFNKKGRYVIKRIMENKIITYEDKSFTFKTYEEANIIATAITAIENGKDSLGWKHKIDNMGYWPSKIK